VKTVHTGAGGPIPSGATRSFTVETSGKFNQFSVVTMLVNTNDAFTGLDSLRLRGHGSSRETMAYDAGSERNNELKSHIPGPCCGNPFIRDPEVALIAPHEGITGRGQLSPACTTGTARPLASPSSGPPSLWKSGLTENNLENPVVAGIGGAAVFRLMGGNARTATATTRRG